MATVLARLPGGKELHALHELQPICFRMPAPRRVREAQAIDDFGAVTAERRNSPVRHYPHDPLALLAAEGVPIDGVTEGASIGSPMIGVEFPSRTRGSRPDMTYAVLRESGVPLAPKPRRRRGIEEDMSFADWHGAEEEDETRTVEDEDETEMYMSGEGAEDEGGEEEDGEDAGYSLERFAEEVGELAHDASRGLGLLAQALRQRRATGSASGFYG